MKEVRLLLALALVFGVVTAWPLRVLAQEEHGGKEHAGGEAATEEQGGEAAVEDDASVLNEAADALEATHPDLAAKLRALAGK